jgi:hypothetical protein
MPVQIRDASLVGPRSNRASLAHALTVRPRRFDGVRNCPDQRALTLLPRYHLIPRGVESCPMLAISDRIVQPDADRMGRAAIIEL